MKCRSANEEELIPRKSNNVGHVSQIASLSDFCLFILEGSLCLCWHCDHLCFLPICSPSNQKHVYFISSAHSWISQENKSIPFAHSSHSSLLPKTMSMLFFFLLYPFFQELNQNYDAPSGQMFSLLLLRSFFTSRFSLSFFSPYLNYLLF